MKKALLALGLIVAAGAGVFAFLRNGRDETAPRVNEAAISYGTIVHAVQATGTLEALRNVQVGSQVSGVVKALYADFNSIVRKDEVIAELDPALLQVQVDVQRANVARQQGDIAQQLVLLESDRKNLDRMRVMFDNGLASAQQLEAAELQVKTREAAIESAKKQLVQAEANLHQAELNVSYCTIRSPVDGVVVDRKVDIGQTVQASMTTPQFFTIAADLTTLKLAALVDESDIGFVRRGMPVTFTVDAYGQQTFRGTVDAVRLNAQTTNNVVTYPVWITVRNDDLRLRPGMTANLKITVDQAAGVLRIPNQALRFRPTSDMYAWLGLTPPAAGARPRPVLSDSSAPPRAATASPAVPLKPRSATQIDDLFSEVPKRIQNGQVWVYDDTASDPARRLRAVNVRVGLSDGQFSELISSDEPLAAGAEVVTGIFNPAAVAKAPAANIFNQRGR